MLALYDWTTMAPSARALLLARPAAASDPAIEAAVAAIVADVRARGDAALAELGRRFDGVAPEPLAVGAAEFEAAEAALSTEARAALERAIDNVRRFHAAQAASPLAVEISPGVRCERIEVPIRAVGLYVPAGSAPLPSTAIMTAVPAAIAGCPTRVLCTPPRRDGTADPAILAVARRCGVGIVFKVGGAQAIAALAYGTRAIPKVDKIFGPGNAYVAAAKQLVSRDPAGAALDLPAGPSEVLVIADRSARASFVAADLLAQAEHDTAAQVLLVTPSRELARAVAADVERQLASLPRQAIARGALSASRAIVVPDLETAFEVSNAYAPEHLILAIEDARGWLKRVTAAGAVFLGHWSPETVGDYCSGANHVLPTNGFARTASGLSLADFLKRISVQELSPEGLRALGPIAATLARHEGLDGHARAVTLRLEALAPT